MPPQKPTRRALISYILTQTRAMRRRIDPFACDRARGGELYDNLPEIEKVFWRNDFITRSPRITSPLSVFAAHQSVKTRYIEDRLLAYSPAQRMHWCDIAFNVSCATLKTESRRKFAHGLLVRAVYPGAIPPGQKLTTATAVSTLPEQWERFAAVPGLSNFAQVCLATATVHPRKVFDLWTSLEPSDKEQYAALPLHAAFTKPGLKEAERSRLWSDHCRSKMLEGYHRLVDTLKLRDAVASAERAASARLAKRRLQLQPPPQLAQPTAPPKDDWRRTLAERRAAVREAHEDGPELATGDARAADAARVDAYIERTHSDGAVHSIVARVAKLRVVAAAEVAKTKIRIVEQSVIDGNSNVRHAPLVKRCKAHRAGRAYLARVRAAKKQSNAYGGTVHASAE